MTDTEFELIDELYFVISFQDLCQEVELEKTELIDILLDLYRKTWIRVFDDPDGQADADLVNEETIVNSYLLASKSGLKAHNS